MRLLTASDLHFSHHRGGAAAFFADVALPDPIDYDVAVIAGDVGNPVMEAIEHVARHYARAGKPVVYVSGNHDFYRGLPGQAFEFTFVEEQKALLREFASQNGIIVLDRECVVIDGVRFAGCTGWPEFAAELVPHNMTLNDAKSFSSKGWAFDNPFDRTTPHNDFREIRVGKGNNRHNLTPSKMIEWAKEDNAFLRDALAQPFDGETVVVTHVGPASIVKPGMMSWLYGSGANEDVIVGAGVGTWIHGHTHLHYDIVLGETTRVVSNARGYPGEDRNFDPALIIEVGCDLTPSMRI